MAAVTHPAVTQGSTPAKKDNAPQQTQTPTSNAPLDLGKFILAWVVMIVGLIMVGKTAIGQKLLYWAFWLVVLLLVVAHGPDIAGLLNNGENLNPNG